MGVREKKELGEIGNKDLKSFFKAFGLSVIIFY